MKLQRFIELLQFYRNALIFQGLMMKNYLRIQPLKEVVYSEKVNEPAIRAIQWTWRWNLQVIDPPPNPVASPPLWLTA